MTDIVSNQNYSLATGTNSTNPFVIHFQTRDPTPQDVNYSIQKLWFNTVNQNMWILTGFATNQGVITAIWDDLTSGTTTTESLTGNSGGKVFVDGANNINVVGDTTTVNIVGNPGTHTLTASTAGSVATTYTGNSGTATPSAGNLNVLGASGLTVAGAGSTLTITGSGVSVDSMTVDAHTNPGTNPVLPNAGTITVTGGQVAAGTTTNVIRTDSLAANTYTIQVQRSTAAASTTIGDNGVCHFSSTNFAVDANGFVTLANGNGVSVIKRQVITTTSTYTPSAGMLYADFQVVGGGGGGGGTTNTGGGQTSSAGGGGAGGYAQGVFSAASVGASQAITIGAGGTAGATGGGTGGTGGTTTVGTLGISATGGIGGTGSGAGSNFAIAGGNGGAGSGGDFQTTGQPGSFSIVVTAVALPGFGGNSFFGGGGNNNGGGAGFNAESYGGGGGGSQIGGTQTGIIGGTGFAGVVIVTEYCT